MALAEQLIDQYLTEKASPAQKKAMEMLKGIRGVQAAGAEGSNKVHLKLGGGDPLKVADAVEKAGYKKVKTMEIDGRNVLVVTV